MALLHRAELRPSKLELLAAWLPGQGWFDSGPPAEVTRVAAYRFDDPAGAVGVETLLVRVGDGSVHQVPLTYRGAPLDGADDRLVGTVHHSVLGPRWVYDACGDPVYPVVLTAAILGGAAQAQEFFEVDGVREYRAPNMEITSSAADRTDPPTVAGPLRVTDSDPTLIVTDTVELAVVRRLGAGAVRPGAATLAGTWPGQPTPVPLAYAVPR
ncbi:hypothetical protein E1193_03210 [Micromonospora sp. KC606]|uniref:CG0192-related protein n=1 Tax=Micromonospora sp. KC606 TaxID=2530379 RepID=UPI001051D9E2|nr:hypothetical protein [Micromonospora sp. KC606]TDC85319.1 hypothetical protein E1193_03210 [Micromonospora sp. KC606]